MPINVSMPVVLRAKCVVVGKYSFKVKQGSKMKLFYHWKLAYPVMIGFFLYIFFGSFVCHYVGSPPTFPHINDQNKFNVTY